MPAIGHSAKRSCLPSVFYLTLGKANANSNWAGRFALCCRVFFYFAECLLTHGKTLPSAREKALGKGCFAVSLFAECCLPNVTLGKGFAECIRAFVECS